MKKRKNEEEMKTERRIETGVIEIETGIEIGIETEVIGTETEIGEIEIETERIGQTDIKIGKEKNESK